MYINWKRKEVTMTLVLYGPQASGKTTIWHYLARGAEQPPQDGETTICLRLKDVQGKQVLLQIRDTSGHGNAVEERRVALYGVDGLLFIVDSTAGREQDNLTTLKELQQNLQVMQKSSQSMPFIFLYNKRDLPQALSVEVCHQRFNPDGFLPFYETVATEGQQLVPALQQVTDLILRQVLQ